MKIQGIINGFSKMSKEEKLKLVVNSAKTHYRTFTFLSGSLPTS